MRSWRLGALALLAVWVAGCGGNSTPLGIVLFPSGVPPVTVVINNTQQFTARVTGSSTTTVTWQVCQPPTKANGTPVNCGMAGLGTITTTGLYTAPPTVPNPNNAIVVATSTVDAAVFATAAVLIDSGIRVQISPTNASIGTTETLQFTATVNGTTNKAVTWSVNQIAGGNSTVGTITPNGVQTAIYAAPATPPGAITIAATSAADSSQSGSTSLSVTAPLPLTLTRIEPTVAAQGSVQQDIYLAGSGFFTTSTAVVGGVPVATTFVNFGVLRATIPAAQFTAAGAVPVKVQSQKGDMSSPLQLSVQPVRPALIASSPDSVSQNASNAAVNLTGGFFSPSTTAQFNGQAVGISPSNSRQMAVNIPANSLSIPGLYPVVVQNSGIPAGQPAIAAVNLAVQPNPNSLPTAPQATVSVGRNPTAVAIDEASDLALVVNTGDGTANGSVSLFDLSTNPPTPAGTIAVGKKPTGIGVDDLLPHHVALVINNADNTVSAIDLTTKQVGTTPLPNGTTPFSVGINPVTHRALVANQSTNLATILDLSAGVPSVVTQVGGDLTVYSTGPNPEVAVDPRLNWAVVTPGGAGNVNLVDLGRNPSPGDPAGHLPAFIGPFRGTTSMQGIGINSETHQALLTDPSGTTLTTLSLLDQTVGSISFSTGQVNYVASAVNPLTNIGIAVNSQSATAAVVDLGNGIVLKQNISVGNSPAAVAIDAASNEAVVVNPAGLNANGSISILSLGSVRSPQIVEASPAITFAPAAAPLSLTITGGGFTGSSQVLLDGTALPPAQVTLVSSRQIVASIPQAMLDSARRYIVAVQDPGPVLSNATDLTVVQPIVVGSSPLGVAVDTDRDLAIVTNSADGTVSLVSLAPPSPIAPESLGPVGTIGSPVPVQANPQGVASIPRRGQAVVANNGGNSITIIDVTGSNVPNTVSLCGTCAAPIGVAANQDSLVVGIANSLTNNISFFDMKTNAFASLVNVDQDPTAIAIDPTLNLAGIGTSSQTSSLDIVNIGTGALSGRIAPLQLPSGVVFDALNQMFLVADSLQNSVAIVDPSTLINVASPRVGIDPTALDYNFQTSTLVTTNFVSHTVSVLDYLCPPTGTPACPAPRARTVIGLGGSKQFSIAIDPKLNLAVVADQANNRVLLLPLPH
jgi:DNA-binding beta-propeller fold protein YncE